MASSEGKEPSSQSPELLSEKQGKSQTPESSKSNDREPDEQMKRKLAILPSSASPDKTPQPRIREQDLIHHAQRSESVDDIDDNDGKQIHFV